MKTPPPDPNDPARAADAAFYRSLVDLGERTSALQTPRAPRRRRRRLARVVALALLAVLALGSAAVATKVLLAADDPVKTDQDPGKHIAQAPADRRLGAARAKDLSVSLVLADGGWCPLGAVGFREGGGLTLKRPVIADQAGFCRPSPSRTRRRDLIGAWHRPH